MAKAKDFRFRTLVGHVKVVDMCMQEDNLYQVRTLCWCHLAMCTYILQEVHKLCTRNRLPNMIYWANISLARFL